MLLCSKMIFSQAPGCPNVFVSDDIELNCNSSSEVNLSADYIQLGETTNYRVEKIDYNPPFTFSGSETPVSVGVDDVWSPNVSLPFNFCFYGNMYDECVISSNGVISFNTSMYKPGSYSQWYLGNTIPSTGLFLNSIFSVYQDMEPSLGGEIAYEVLGEAPCRKLVISYHDVPMYLCSGSKANFQIALYETTNIIEVYIKEKSICQWWNNGNAVLGIQNAQGTIGVSPDGRNTSKWDVKPSSPEAWRFIPSGEEITSIKWYDSAQGGNVIGSSNDIVVSPNTTTDYRAEVLYMMCDGSEVIKTDTVKVTVKQCPTTIDFDGVDDFINVDPLIDSANDVTMMAWVKLENSASNESHIVGQSNLQLLVRNDKTIIAKIKTNNGDYVVNSLDVILDDKWSHVSTTYDGNELKLFVDGVFINSVQTGNSVLSLSSTDFFIGKDVSTNTKHFSGSIQEVKVFSKSLTIEQIREQVFQPIKNKNGLVYGAITNKKISEGLLWGDLNLYLKLSHAVAGKTPDKSSNIKNAFLNNMTTSQLASAPLPYIANQSGDWFDNSIWKNGNEININKMTNYEWAIVQLTNSAKVTTNVSHRYLALLIDENAELIVDNNQLIENTNYLKLSGKIDLIGESQLIQTENSTLDISSSGYVERDQKGLANTYRYNYWCSPVSAQSIEANNKDFSISTILKDGTDPTNPLNIVFDNNNKNGSPSTPITLSESWIYTFENNANNYMNWNHIKSSGSIKVGQGFTLKGSGASNVFQNYVFKGKPNNGSIKHKIDGENLFLVGNPYLSALDANIFIMDNIGQNGSINGTLYFWEHWGGDSHNVLEYEGGYATYNLLGSTKAVSHPVLSSDNDGNLEPKRYIPVAQGFFVKGDSNGGEIKFSNSQRVFKKENDGNSVFFKTSKTENNSEVTENNDVIKTYLRFLNPEGAERELLLGVKNGLSSNYEVGYDAERMSESPSDCAWLVEDKKCVIQGIGEIFSGLELPLVVNISSPGDVSFSINDLTFLPEGLNVFLKDKENNQVIEFKESIPITLYLSSNVFNDRFFIVFNSTTLSTDQLEVSNPEYIIYYDSNFKKIIFKSNSNLDIENLIIYNVLGQVVKTQKEEYVGANFIEVPVKLSSGIYFLNYKNKNRIKTDKIVIK